MITIYDIAKETGYSAPTISKALNGTGGLSEKTRRKILETAEKMGYRPNMAARSLSTKKSYLIGIIFEDNDMQRGFEHPLFGGILNRFRQEMENSGYDLIFLSRSFDSKNDSYLAHCYHRNVDAVVIINPLAVDDGIIELAKSDIPCVSTNDIIPGIPAVVSANEDAGYEAGKYLINMGHTKIGYISGSHSLYNLASIDRLRGFRRALSEAGIEHDDSYVVYSSYWSRHVGFEAMKNLLDNHSDITAVFGANDDMVVGAMEYAKSIGMKLPDDMSFIGFDDELFSAFHTPSLTTFRQNRKMIGEIAAEILINKITGIPVSDCIRVSADFIIRNSVKKLE